ncbi:hypothetical protein GQ42DRAFT_130275 [Ramicandelaber brevisporus]|nr:hypothetical protein GQ42DRAFT_130275 [Ramicandelaber brevisporus]
MTTTATTATATAAAAAASNVAKGRGAFILFEGGDRCGKTTQCARLVSALKARGIPVESLRFPDRTTTVGKLIDSYLTNATDLNDQAIHLLFSVNRWEAMAAFKRKLNEGITLVVDRYSYSGVAYSAAKGLDLEWCKTVDKGLIRPDLILFMDIGDVQNAQERGGFGNERYETATMQTRVNEMFAAIKQEDWNVVDARDSIENIAAKIEKVALETIDKCGDLLIREDLWVNNSAMSQWCT